MGFLSFISILVVITLAKCQNTTVGLGEFWWGPGDPQKCNDSTITPFKIVFEKEMIKDLKNRLQNYRPSNPTFPDVGFQYGFNSREIPGWIDYWGKEYPFKEREGYLNKYPQYRVKVQGLCIHFIRVIPKVPPGVKIVPLLLLHGWPGSVREFYDTIPYLTAVSAKRKFALEVIAPSLPGFAYSDAAVRPGLCSANIAILLKNFMRILGHSKFCVQGGDWGSVIASDMSTMFPQNVIGFHNNFALSVTYTGLIRYVAGAFDPTLVVKPELTDRMYPLREKLVFLLREFGYFHLQATKPDTVGVAMSDSPVGLLAYILQIFSTGTGNYVIPNEDGGLSHYPKATLIDNLMLYWASNSITSSFRIYAESYNKQFYSQYDILKQNTTVPTWVLQAKNEVIYQSPTVLKTKYPNLLHATVLDDGGHFIALEKPRVFADDVLKAVEAFLNWRRDNNE